MPSTAITDAGLVHLRGLTGLRKLVLWGTRVTDVGLVHLRGLVGLRELDLERTVFLRLALMISDGCCQNSRSTARIKEQFDS